MDSLETHHISQDSDGQKENSLSTKHIAEEKAPSPTKDDGLESSPTAQAPTDAAGTRQIKPESPPTEGVLGSGTVLQGRYQIVGVLGMGGMASVYKARDLRFPNVNKLCAVKQMSNTAADPQLRAMAIQNFEREADILATLNHPAVPQVYDYFSEATRSYLVMEIAGHVDLETMLAELPPGEFFPVTQVLDWALQICEVLTYLHSRKPQPIIFRDLKPGNVMLDSHDRIRLIDFGIAKVFQTGQKGTMIGTEGYSPPEQYRGHAEPRGDIYALGATMHHLLTKQDPRLEPPFSFQERPIITTNPNVSTELEAVIMKALEYDIDNRYGSVEEFKQALLSAGKREGIRSPQAGYSAGPLPSADMNYLWRFACEDEVRSTPAISQGLLYVGCYDHNLYALNTETGEFVWKFPTDGGIASTPAVYEDRILVGSEDRVLYAINTYGQIEWTSPTQGRIRSSPRVHFDHVFFGSDDHHIYAANAMTGRVAWKVDMGAPIRSSVAFSEDDFVYFGVDDGTVVALDIQGKLRWRFRTRRAVMSSPYLDQGEDVLYVGSLDGNVYALDARSGWAVWRFRSSGPIVSSPVAAHGKVFVGSADGHMYALDIRNGHPAWKYATDNQVTSSPAFANGAVYFGGIDHYIYCVDGETGDLRWRFQTEGPVPGSPIVVGDVVYIGSTDRYVYAIPG